MVHFCTNRSLRVLINQELQDNRQGHYNWVSQTNTIKNEFNVSTEQSDYNIKHKIKEKYGENLKEDITKCLNQCKKTQNLCPIQVNNEI